VALLPNRFLARRYKRVRGFAAPGLCAPFNSNVECLLPQLSKDCSGHELPLVDAPISGHLRQCKYAMRVMDAGRL